MAPLALAVCTLLAACATAAPPPAGHQTKAQRAAACRSAVRDRDSYCRESIIQSKPELQYRCLDARLRFNRSCYPD